VQILLGFEPLSESVRSSLPDAPFCDSNCVQTLWKRACAVNGKCDLKPPEDLAAQVRRKMTNFLRCACVLFHFITDIPLSPKSTFEDMMGYLGLPVTLRDAVMTLGAQDILDNLLHGGRAHKFASPDLPLRARRLIDLPVEYRTLVDMAAKFRCPNNGFGECKHPCLCLICGEIVCSQVR